MNGKRVERRIFAGESIDVALKQAISPASAGGRFPPVQTEVLVASGIMMERDVPVPLRDGTIIYADVYRPAGVTDVPAIIAWSPYGKRAGYADPPGLVPGVPPGTLSPGTKFEGPDPDYWCRRGYAIINPDSRGAGFSEGTLQIWTRQEARDSADLVEWVADRDWCNGRVGMSGNSWLAVAQWGAAAERPPHLACIAPWEGTTDPYRQMFFVGGVPQVGFRQLLDHALVGEGLTEDLDANAQAHPFYDAYWQEKVAELEKITVPAYITAGWSHFHLWGALEAFNRISSENKWLRVHREFEWPDAYAPRNLEDLGRFFDRYLKGHHNGWELTPRVRIEVMDRGDRDHVVNRPEISFPLPETEYKKLFLNAADMVLAEAMPDAEACARYDAQTGTAVFDMTFDEDTELTGYLSLRLWVEADGSDDLDLFIAVQKADEVGEFIPTFVMGRPHPGAPGILRVSQRELDQSASSPAQPVHLHRKEECLTPGEIVPVDIPIWPHSRFWHAGERLRVVVSGHYIREETWFEAFSWDTRNKGTHIIHAGGRFDSHLLVPKIPPRRAVRPGASITAHALPAAWEYAAE